ncbi:trypco2 family protein [Streptomyces sp. NPDC059378]|uniref:trypco2 family protein n=1 Tax=Streptomyces sp. NPDC059378 TaxID=3346815 RepID=UPI0036C5A2E2
MIELSQLIAELRRELVEATSEGDGQELRFQLGPVELEASITVIAEGSTGGKVRFWVVDADAAAKLARESVHTVRLTLEPVLVDQDVDGSERRRSPLISGRAERSER